MTQTVSITEMRSNISHYLQKAQKGTRIIIHDEKRKQPIAQITCVFSFDKGAYEKVLKRSAGTFISQNHPEWRNKSEIISWLRKNRLADDRSFK